MCVFCRFPYAWFVVTFSSVQQSWHFITYISFELFCKFQLTVYKIVLTYSSWLSKMLQLYLFIILKARFVEALMTRIYALVLLFTFQHITTYTDTGLGLMDHLNDNVIICIIPIPIVRFISVLDAYNGCIKPLTNTINTHLCSLYKQIQSCELFLQKVKEFTKSSFDIINGSYTMCVIVKHSIQISVNTSFMPKQTTRLYLYHVIV